MPADLPTLRARVAAMQALAAGVKPWKAYPVGDDEWMIASGIVGRDGPLTMYRGVVAEVRDVSEATAHLLAAAPDLVTLAADLWAAVERERAEATRWKESAAIHRRAADQTSRVLFDQFRVADPGTAAAYLARAEAAESERDEARAELTAIRTALGDGADEAAWPPGMTAARAVERLRGIAFPPVRTFCGHVMREDCMMGCIVRTICPLPAGHEGPHAEALADDGGTSG